MRPARWWFLAVCVLGGLPGCRDEQAGPRPSTPPPAAPPGPQSSQPPPPPPENPPAAASPGGVLDAAPKELTFQSGATLGQGAVQYVGSRLEPSKAKAGSPIRLHHYFRALKDPPQGFQFFMHAIDPQSGQMLANLDHEIAGGGMPLASWPKGKVVEDVHDLMIPPGFSGGVRLVLGFWRGEERLPVDDPKAHDGAHRMTGPLIETEQGSAPEVPRGPELPRYAVKRAKKAPAIDGDLADPAWQEAAPVNLQGSLNGQSTSVRTTARLLYDDQNLYVSFDCEDPHIWGTLFKRDEPIYGQEAVEIFLDADADGKTYNELQVSPNNTVFDAYFPERRTGMDLSFDSGLKSAVKFKGTINNPSDRDEGWTVEMQIPVARLAKVPHPPRKGDHWRFNLYRLDGEAGRQEGMSFSPLFVGDFHHLPRFGWLDFD